MAVHKEMWTMFRNSELCDGLHAPLEVGTLVVFTHGQPSKTGKPIAVGLRPADSGAQRGVVGAFSGAAGHITPLNSGTGSVPFRLASCEGFTRDRPPQSGDLVQFRTLYAGSNHQPEAAHVRPMGTVHKIVDKFHGYLSTRAESFSGGAPPAAAASTTRMHGPDVRAPPATTMAHGARRAQPIYIPGSTELVGIVVDGFSFLKGVPGNMDAAAAVVALERVIADTICERTGHDVFIPEGALVFFHPNPVDAEEKGIISTAKLLETVKTMERVRGCGWTVVHTPFKKVAGRWTASAEDVALSNQVTELVKPERFPPLGARRERTTLHHVIVVTTDNDHVSTLRLEQGQALRWCASPAGAPRGRDLQRWGASVGGRFFEVSLAPQGATRPFVDQPGETVRGRNAAALLHQEAPRATGVHPEVPLRIVRDCKEPAPVRGQERHAGAPHVLDENHLRLRIHAGSGGQAATTTPEHPPPVPPVPPPATPPRGVGALCECLPQLTTVDAATLLDLVGGEGTPGAVSVAASIFWELSPRQQANLTSLATQEAVVALLLQRR